MRSRLMAIPRTTILALSLLVVVAVAPLALAAVDAAPNSVQVIQGNASEVIQVIIVGDTRFSQSGQLLVNGLPAGTTTDPAPPIPYSPGAPTEGQTSFRFLVGASTAPGFYGVTLTDSNGFGSANVSLQVVAAGTFEAAISPNPVTLQRGGSAKPVTVITTADPGFTGSITYSFSGFPSFISAGGAMTVTAGGGYAPATFPFAASASTTPGTYTGLLMATSGSTTKTYSMTVIVQRPDVSVSFTQVRITLCNDGTPGSNSLSIQPIEGYNGTPLVEFINVPAGITVTPSSFTSPPPPALLPFTISANGANIGDHAIAVRVTDASAGIDRTTTFVANVQPSDFTPALTGAITVVAGGDPGNLTASATRIGCLSANLVVTSSGAPAGLTVTPAVILTAPIYAGVPLMVQAAANTPSGAYPITFTFTPANGGPARTLSALVTVVAPPDFELRVEPPAVTIEAGQSATVVVSLDARNGFSGPVAVSVQAPGSVSVTPATFTLTPGGSRTVTITAPANATPATIVMLVSGTSPQVASVRTAQVIVSLTPRAPALIVATPPSVATGMRSMTIRLTGANIKPGASITTTRSDVIIESVTILSESLADVVLSVRSDAAPGPVPFVVTNPGGLRSNAISVIVVPASSLSAPLGVSAALIVYPASGTMFTRRDSVYPRGLLATTGTGIVTGMWLLDGLPFDRFVVTVAGGMPAEVRSHIPVPWGVIGTHRLELAIDAPRQAISPAVDVLMSASSVSRLLVFAPRDGMVASAATLFRWSLMPNAGGYVVELEQLG